MKTEHAQRHRFVRESTWLLAGVVTAVIAILIGYSFWNSQRAVQAGDSDLAYPQPYVEYWERVTQAVAGEADDPIAELTAVARGQQLRSLLAGVEQNQSNGIVTVGPVERRLLTVLEEESRIYVLDCIDISRWLLADAESGEPVEGQQVNEPDQAYVFTMAERNGEWYVTDSNQIGTCADAG